MRKWLLDEVSSFLEDSLQDFTYSHPTLFSLQSSGHISLSKKRTIIFQLYTRLHCDFRKMHWSECLGTFKVPHHRLTKVEYRTTTHISKLGLQNHARTHSLAPHLDYSINLLIFDSKSGDSSYAIRNPMMIPRSSVSI